MKYVSTILVSVLLVATMIMPAGISAESMELAKGEMTTVYECGDSWAFNPRLSDDKLFFMTTSDISVESVAQNCLTYDLKIGEYDVIHEVEDKSSIRGGYSWKTCINNDYIFWQEWTKNGDEDSVLKGYITNLENKNLEKQFEFSRDNPRIAISDDNLFVYYQGNRWKNIKSEIQTISLADKGVEFVKKDELEGLQPQNSFRISANKIILSKRLSADKKELFIYNIKTEELTMVTDENNPANNRTASLQGDYLFYFKERNILMAYYIPTGTHKLLHDLGLKENQNSYKFFKNPNGHFAVFFVSTWTGAKHPDSDFENYLLVIDPDNGNSKQIHLSNNYMLSSTFYMSSIPRMDICWDKKVVFEIPGEHNYFGVYDGETDTISKVDIERSYKWCFSDLQIHGNTIVWKERFHGKLEGKNCPRKLKIFKFED